METLELDYTMLILSILPTSPLNTMEPDASLNFGSKASEEFFLRERLNEDNSPPIFH